MLSRAAWNDGLLVPPDSGGDVTGWPREFNASVKKYITWTVSRVYHYIFVHVTQMVKQYALMYILFVVPSSECIFTIWLLHMILKIRPWFKRWSSLYDLFFSFFSSKTLVKHCELIRSVSLCNSRPGNVGQRDKTSKQKHIGSPHPKAKQIYNHI